MIRRDTRRRLDQFIANPACRANVLSAVHDIPMSDVSASLGLDARAGQSPFAIGRGVTFERSLYADGAARLFAALVAAGIIAASAAGFVDLRTRLNGGPVPDLDEACARFAALLRRFAEAVDTGGDPRTPAAGAAPAALPAIIAAPALRIPGRAILPDGMFAVDVVTVHPDADGVVLRVGEIKVYPDRGGHTDPHQLATTRAQAGIYLHALRLAVADAGVGARVSIADDGFLVLTRPGSNAPSVRAHEDLTYQAQRAERAFERLREAAALEKELPEDDGAPTLSARRLAVVRDAPTAYDEACVSFCELEQRCHADAVAAGNAAVLGRDVARFLGAVPLDRALALLDGAAPAGPVEEDFVRRARDARGLVSMEALSR